MLQPSLDIPRPSSADNETVITALETAALFGSKGDAHEAMRWLRRAAESAGEAGDDVRALALSRTAADLSEELHVKRAQAATPSPPPLPSAPPSVPRPSAAPPSVRSFYPTPPSSRPGHAVAASGPPAAPSTAPAALAAPTAAAAGPARATRVSIQRSPTVPGVFEVRVLGDGESARSGDGEAFLVMVDPQSTLLSS